MNEINVKVLKEFLDRYTGKKRVEGETFKVTYARLREIRRSGDFVEVVTETKTKESKEKK